MGDAAKTSPRIFSTCTHNSNLSLQNTHITPSQQIYGAIHNPSLVPSIACFTTSSNLRNYVLAADNVTYTDKLENSGYHCYSYLYKFQDGIQVTQVSMYGGESLGSPVLNESSILVQELGFE